MQETINQRIKQYRRKLNYTQQQIALKIGMKPSTYSQMERSGKISGEIIKKLAQILEVDALTLLYGENENNTKDITPFEIKPEIPTTPPQNPFETPKLTFDDLTARETALVKMFKNISEPNKTLVYEFVYRVFQIKDIKKVIKKMNLEN